MELEQLSAWASKLSLESFLQGDFSGLLPVLYLGLAIAVYSVVIWHFYRYISRRDCFKLRYCKHPQIVTFLKYFFLFPFVAFLFFLGFVLLMFFLTRELSIEIILTTAFSIILAIRITAYYNEDLSKDVAKMLPFALLGIFLVDPSYFNFEAIQTKIQTLPNLMSQALQLLVIIVLVEWVLRILLTIRYKLFPQKQQAG